jgi:phosphoribosylformylglycinamidine (FGAM) synthase PurS component
MSGAGRRLSGALEGLDAAEAAEIIERIAREVLANPVIEQFRFEIVE